MIVGVGIDIIEVERVALKLNRNNGFLEKVFSPAEIAACKSSVSEQESFAARFAAKEAFLKATGKGLSAGHDLCDIEVLNEESGKPSIQLRNSFAELGKENGWNKVHVSLAHIKSTAGAMVIIES